VRAKSDPPRPLQVPVGCLYAFFSGGVLAFSLFALIGSAFLYMATIRPALLAHASRQWMSAPCTVVSSAVAPTIDNDSPGHTLNIVYRYGVNGRSYESSRYAFRPINTRAEAEAIVSRLPAGSDVDCYVSGDDPSEAVIDRELGSYLWLGLIPGAFVAVGLIGAIGSALAIPVAVRRTRVQGDPGLAVPLARPRPVPVAAPAGLRVLTPREPRGSYAIGLWFVALFWNGITGAVGGGALWGLLFGGGDPVTGLVGVPLLLLFLTPFILIGAALAYFAGRQTLLYIGPRAHLTAPAAIALGRSCELQWQISGRVVRMRSLRIDLEGREEATYRRGTDTTTDKRVFARVPVFESRDPRALDHGRALVNVPRDSMPSFAAPNNKIVWLLRVRADVPRWPDIDDEFVIEVGG
jgi:hypothetical protein